MWPTPRIVANLVRVVRIASFVLGVAGAASAAPAGTVEQTTLEHLDRLRHVEASKDDAAIARYNRQMDDAWGYFTANRAAVVPLLRQQLDAELRMPTPNNLVLLDVGYFLTVNGEPADQERATAALLATDSSAPVIRQNDKELFEFTHRVAALHDARILPFIDKAFLRDRVTVFIPQHSLRLDETLVCVFLYGVYGDGAEQHLQPLLADRTVARKVIETLVWIGSPASVPDVKRGSAVSPDYDTFIRATAFMMQAGGPQGRVAMLDVREADLDERTRAYYAKVRPAIASTDYVALRKPFGAAKSSRLSDEAVRARLSAMIKHDGKDDVTQPVDILDSTVPANELVRELMKVRARTFRRLSDEALSDVEMTNALINALRYRDKGV